MRAAVYLRISEDKAGEELGVARQREDTEALVRQRGWTLVESYVDNDISASDKGRKTRRRPAYEALMAAADAKQIDRIVVWHTSRFWRSRRERADGIERLKAARVSVVPVKGPELDMTTAYGRGMAGLVGEFDTMEVEVKSERQTREAQQRAADGKPPGGRRAFGYDTDGITVVKAEAAAVRKAYKALVAGKSLSTIAAQLNAAGFTTTMGGEWRHNAVRNMLKNPRYVARRAYRGEVVADATWPAIVAVDVWEAAQAILAGPDRRTNHVGSERKWLGGGLYRCGREGCGGVMACTYRQGGKRIYRCKRKSCLLSRLAEPVDEWVDEVVRARLAREELADLLASPAATVQGRADLAELRARRKSLAKLLVDGVLTEDDVREEAARLDDQLAAADRAAMTDDRRGLASLVRAKDPVRAWIDSDPQAQHDALARLATVTLLPVPSGRRAFDRTTVEIIPRRLR